jgi:hypothetical protein
VQTIHLDIQDDKLNTFLTIINNLKGGIVEQIRFEKKNNRQYSIDEARAKLGF